MASAEYTKTPLGEGVRFNVTPAPKALGGCAGILLIFLIAVSGGMISALILGLGETGGTTGTLVFMGLVVFGFLKMDLRKKNHKTPSQFFVNNDSVQVNGKTIFKNDIHRIIIKNAYDNTPHVQLTGQPVSTGTGAGIDIRNALEQISYSVNVEAGGKAIQLAGGLDETTAFGLLTEVKRILEIENQ